MDMLKGCELYKGDCYVVHLLTIIVMFHLKYSTQLRLRHVEVRPLLLLLLLKREEYGNVRNKVRMGQQLGSPFIYLSRCSACGRTYEARGQWPASHRTARRIFCLCRKGSAEAEERRDKRGRIRRSTGSWTKNSCQTYVRRLLKHIFTLKGTRWRWRLSRD